MLSIDYKTTRGFVSVHTQRKRILVKVDAVVGFDVPDSSKMLEYVGRTSGEYLFGHLAVLPDPESAGKNMVLFTYTLLANELDEEELTNAVAAVVATAEKLDNGFVKDFGGRTFR
jgi:hypothetical protein